jgi:uncharacterized protein with GYD domain
MSTDLVLTNSTDKDARSAVDTVDRYEAAKSDLDQCGLIARDSYWKMAYCDLVTVFEAPDEETLGARLLRLSPQENLRTTMPSPPMRCGAWSRRTAS